MITPRLRLAAAFAGACLLFSCSPALAREAQSRAVTQASGFVHSRPGVSEAYIVSFGLFGRESVFEREARGAAQVLGERLAPAQSLVRFNTKRGGSATSTAIAAALKAAGAAMDPEEDILVLALTSHGSPEGLAVQAGRRAGVLSPVSLKAMLDASSARYRIVILSACYSGVFVPVLADPRTLVITAASADRPSFGCEDGATWTYFGEAFYDQALRHNPTIEQAFRAAREIVTRREREEGFEPSNPQIGGGSEVLAFLARRR